MARLRRSINMTSRHRPWCWPMRWRVPHDPESAALCRAGAGGCFYRGKITRLDGPDPGGSV